MMTTKVVRPPLGRRERGWQGETELLPLPEPFFPLSFSLCRASRREKEGAREGMDEAGWITILPSTESVRLLQPGNLNWLLSLRKRKKKEKKLTSSLPPSLLPPRRHPSPWPPFNSVFFNLRHWRISKRVSVLFASNLVSYRSTLLSLSLIIRLGVNLLRNSHRIPWDAKSTRGFCGFESGEPTGG